MGGVNGLYQVTGEILRPVRDKLTAVLHLNSESIGHKAVKTVCTFAMVDFSWIFFRADGIGESLAVIKSMLSNRNPWILFDGSLYTCGLDMKNFNLMLVSILILIVADIFKYHNIQIRKVILRQDYWCRWLVFAVSIWLILVLGIWGPNYNEANFIYFQF